MTLDEFSADFYESVLLRVEAEGITEEDAITSDILEYLRDCGDVLDPELCNYKSRGIKVNAFDYDDEDECIELFVTIAKKTLSVQKVSDKDVLDAFAKGKKFYEAAVDGAAFDKAEQADEQLSDFVSIIQQTKPLVKSVRFFVLTNGLCSAQVVPKASEEGGVKFSFELWDIERVHQQFLIHAGKKKIEIDFERDYNYRLKCLQMDNVSSKVDEYLAILPAKVLAGIYGIHKHGLLEKNVRTFLHFRAKVNNGIRETIRKEPDMFFAYNNGISATAEKAEIRYEDGVTYISRVENLQVVNGGQTTASVFYTSAESDADLSKVFVPMKLSVVKPGNSLDDIVPKISQYANSQTAIKGSDFSSNTVYHLSLEKWSRTEWVPVQEGSKAVCKWYYERTRGQYLDDRSRKSFSKDKAKFDIEYPKKQKFNKTDLAKYEMSWWQRPHEVSKGGEKNFPLFQKEIDNSNTEVTREYFQQVIAKAILFNETDRIVNSKKLGGYKANVVAYVVSLISYKTNKCLNLDAIWESQSLSEELRLVIDKLIDEVWIHINKPSKPGMNITEWCKKQECWLTLKDKYIDTAPLGEYLSKVEAIGNNIQEKKLSEQDMSDIRLASSVSSEVWYGLAKWAKLNSKLTAFDRKLSFSLGVYYSRRTALSIKQSKHALRILETAKNEGFDPESLIVKL